MPPTLLQSKLPQSEKPNLNAEVEIPTWQQEMKTAFRSADEICQFLNIDLAEMEISAPAAKQFGLFVPRGFARRMERGNPDDPLLRQVLNVVQEEVIGSEPTHHLRLAFHRPNAQAQAEISHIDHPNNLLPFL